MVGLRRGRAIRPQRSRPIDRYLLISLNILLTEKEMAMDDPFRRPALTAGVFYKDPWAALDWLEKAFGFERSMVITDKDGKLSHSEMRFGDSLLYVGAEWAEFIASPAAVGGKNTQTIHVHLADGIDAHCA